MRRCAKTSILSMNGPNGTAGRFWNIKCYGVFGVLRADEMAEDDGDGEERIYLLTDKRLAQFLWICYYN